MRQPKMKRRTRGLTKIKQSDVARVARGALAAGMPVRGFEVDPASGKFTVLVGPASPTAGNSWDEILNAKDA